MYKPPGGVPSIILKVQRLIQGKDGRIWQAKCDPGRVWSWEHKAVRLRSFAKSRTCSQICSQQNPLILKDSIEIEEIL